MDKQNKSSIEEYLVYEDKQKLNTLKTTLTVRPNGAYLSLIGVDTPELLDVFKNYLLTFQNTKIFHYKSEQIIDEIISSNDDKTLIIDIFNLKDDFKIENIIQNFRFNRDFIPDKNIRIFIIASNNTLDMFSQKAYDFVTFSNFYGKFKNNKFDFQYLKNDEKLDKFIRSYKKLVPNTPKIIQLKVISELIDEAILMNNNVIAIKYLNIALKKSQKLNDRYLEIHFLNLLGRVHQHNKFTLSLTYLNKALSLVDNIYIEDKAMILSNISNVYKNMGVFDKALSLLEQSVKINKELGRLSGLAINYVNIGAIYHGGDNDKALEYYDKALVLNLKLEDKEGIGTVYNNIGQVYYELYNFNKSLEFLKKSLNIAKNNSYENLIIISLLGLGKVYKRLLDFRLAIKYLNEGKKLSLKLGFKEECIECEENISEIEKYLKINTKITDKVKKIDKKSSNKEEQIEYLIYESNELIKQNNLKDVKEKLKEAQNLADEINLKGLQCEVYMAFYDYYKTINDEKNAQSYYNKANYIIKNSGHKLFEKRLEDIKNSHSK